MLICNLINERFRLLQKQKYGICTDNSTLYNLFNQQLGIDLNCSGVVICQDIETCTPPTITCSLSPNQVTTIIGCSLTATQIEDDD